MSTSIYYKFVLWVISMNTVQKTYRIFADLLTQNKVTPYRVYKETGVPQSSLSEWKRGNSMPKIDKIQKLADYFGVTVDYLLTGGDAAQKNKPSEPSESLSIKEELLLEAFRHMTDAEQEMLLRAAAVKSAELERASSR